MSHVTPLSLSKECIVHCHTMCLSHSVMLQVFLSCCPMFKGDLKKFYLCSLHNLLVSVFLSQSYGYYIHIIPNLCSKFRVVNVGLIMALLRRDYSRRHHIIIREIVLETKLSTLRFVCLNDRFSHSRHMFISWRRLVLKDLVIVSL